MSPPAGYCSLQQQSPKRPLSIGAVGEPNVVLPQDQILTNVVEFFSNSETRSRQGTRGHAHAADTVPFKQDSAIRSHLRLWQEQHTSKPEFVNLEKLPGFDLSGNIQNSVSQLGEIESRASSIGNEADLEVESEPEMDAEGHVGGTALDPRLLKGGDVVIMTCVWPKL